VLETAKPPFLGMVIIRAGQNVTFDMEDEHFPYILVQEPGSKIFFPSGRVVFHYKVCGLYTEKVSATMRGGLGSVTEEDMKSTEGKRYEFSESGTFTAKLRGGKLTIEK